MDKSIIIFDMDGTILNTLEDLTDSCNYILAKHEYPLRSLEEIRSFVGNGIPKLIERAFPSNTEQALLKTATKEFIDYYEEHSFIKTKPYDGIIELLKKLKEHGFMIAVNTNKVEPAAIDLCNKIFPNLFDIISGSKDSLPPKPAPDGIYEILNKANINKENAIFIGDSDVDLQTGFNAGLEVIGVSWVFKGIEFLKEKGAKHIAQNTQELYENILKITNYDL